MQCYRTALRGRVWASSVGRVSPGNLGGRRGLAAARRAVVAVLRGRERGVPRNPDGGTDPAKFAVLGGAGLTAAAVGMVPVALAAEGLDLTGDPLAGLDLAALITENPNGAATAAFAGLIAAELVGMAVARLSRGVRAVRPSAVAQMLKTTRKALVVDIRPKGKQAGGPDWGRYGKRMVSLPHTRNVDGGIAVDATFVKKFQCMRGLGRDTLVVLVDSDGSQAASAARQLLKLKEVGPICYVQGGAMGWKSAGMPWRPTPRLNLPRVSLDGIVDSYRANPGVYKLGLAFYLAALSTALIFSEADVLLEVVGLLAFGQLVLSRMVFADDRSATIRQLREMMDEKIAVGSAGKDLKRLASAVVVGKKKERSVPQSLAPAVNGVSDMNGADGPGGSAPAAASALDDVPLVL